MNAPASRLDDGFLAELRAIAGDRVVTNAQVRERHGRDESYHAGHPPDAVVFALSTDEVVALVRACAARKTPIIPFGVGTSLEGHVAALNGGVCLDLSQMNRILAVRPEDMDASCEAGVTRKQL
ncbi:MAG: FAD-binding protein, partial [Pseudomonadota bacterium]